MAVILVASAATCIASTAPDDANDPTPDPVALSPESIAPFQVDIDLTDDTDTSHPDRLVPAMPLRQANAWRTSACIPVQNSIPLRLLLVAAQAASTDL